MRTSSLRVILTAATTFIILSVGEGAFATRQPNTSPVNNTTMTVNQRINDCREITVINPHNGHRTVIYQRPIPVNHGGKGHSVMVWPEYFPLFFDGYCPSTPYLPAKVVGTAPPTNQVKFTYRAIQQGDQADATITFSLDDIADTGYRRVVTKSANGQGTVNLPKAPAGWEYVNQISLPESFKILTGTGNQVYHLLIQKKARPAVPEPGSELPASLNSEQPTTNADAQHPVDPPEASHLVGNSSDQLDAKLKQLQEPLKKLKEEENLNRQPRLPQAGNKSHSITWPLSIVIAAIIALTYRSPFKKKLNNLG